MADDSTLQKLLDLLFPEDEEVDVVVLQGTFELDPPGIYHAFLYGLEGELVMEMEVAPDRWRGGSPPLEVCIAYTKPPSQIKWTGPSDSVCFDTIRFRLASIYGFNTAYYNRVTPAFPEES